MAITHVVCMIRAAVVFSALTLPMRVVPPDEIQAYIDNVDTPGEFGLRLRANTAPSGIGTPSCPGEVTTSHG